MEQKDLHIKILEGLPDFFDKLHAAGFVSTETLWQYTYQIIANETALEHLGVKLAALYAKDEMQQLKFISIWQKYYLSCQVDEDENTPKSASLETTINDEIPSILFEEPKDGILDKEEYPIEGNDFIKEKWKPFVRGGVISFGGILLSLLFYNFFVGNVSTFVFIVISIFALVVSQFYEYYIYSKNKKSLVVNLNKLKGGTDSWNFNLPSYKLIHFGDSFKRLANKMRERVPTQDQRLDITKTVKNTIKNAGFLDPVYKQGKELPTNLLLIEKSNAQNNRTALFEAWHGWLLERDVEIVCFYYQNSLDWFWNEQYPKGVRIEEIISKYGTCRLFILGEARSLVSPIDNQLTKFSSTFHHWAERILITPLPFELWTQQERALESIFTLTPFSTNGLAILEQQLGTKDDSLITNTHIDDPAITFDESNLPESLLAYFPNPGMHKWLAALSLFPILDWNLVLFLGKLVSDNGNYGNLLTFQNIRQLTRIYWFYNGFIPDEAREKLCTIIPQEERALFHKEIALYLEKQSHAGNSVGDISPNKLRIYLLVHKAVGGIIDKNGIKELEKLNMNTETNFLVAEFKDEIRLFDWELPQAVNKAISTSKSSRFFESIIAISALWLRPIVLKGEDIEESGSKTPIFRFIEDLFGSVINWVRRLVFRRKDDIVSVQFDESYSEDNNKKLGQEIEVKNNALRIYISGYWDFHIKNLVEDALNTVHFNYNIFVNNYSAHTSKASYDQSLITEKINEADFILVCINKKTESNSRFSFEWDIIEARIGKVGSEVIIIYQNVPIQSDLSSTIGKNVFSWDEAGQKEKDELSTKICELTSNYELVNKSVLESQQIGLDGLEGVDSNLEDDSEEKKNGILPVDSHTYKLDQFEKRILKPYSTAVLNYALQLTQENALAEDLVQETFIKAFVKFHLLESETNTLTWVFTICRSIFINDYRKRNVRPQTIELDALDDDGLVLGWENQGTLESNTFGLYSDEVEVALNKLSPKHREIMLLVTDHSYEEIAEILEIEVGTVRSRVSRARKVLADELSGYAKRKGFIKPDISESEMIDVAWALARQLNSLVSYENFIARYPHTHHTNTAKEAIGLLKREIEVGKEKISVIKNIELPIIQINRLNSKKVFTSFQEIKKVKLLCFSPTVKDGSQLKNFKEPSFIDLIVAANYNVIYRHSFNVDNFKKDLLSQEPDILHFNGLGLKASFNLDDVEIISQDLLRDCIQVASMLQLCVFDFDHSLELAKVASQYIPYAIGVQGLISEETSIHFARGFYKALTTVSSVDEAFIQGRLTAASNGCKDINSLILVKGIWMLEKPKMLHFSGHTNQEATKNSLKVFISYSQQDTAYLEKFRSLLRPLEHNGILTMFIDNKISVGEDWSAFTIAQLDEADLVFLLVSPESINSKYLMKKEIPRALSNQQLGKTLVVPILLRECNWYDTEIGKLQGLPRNGMSVQSFINQDEAWFQILKEIKNLLTHKKDQL